MSLALRLAAREMRGGIGGFRVLILCLALGVAAIAAVGTLRAAINAGLADQGAVILGGDAELSFTYRRADRAETDWIATHSRASSEVIGFRSLAVAGQDQALTEVKAVDGNWPLLGQVELSQGTLAEAFAVQDGLPGAIMEPLLADRLGLKPGDRFKMGTQAFRLSALMLSQPDSATSGIGFAPKTVVRTEALAESGLLAPGSMYESHYRLLTGAELGGLRHQAENAFGPKGMEWADRRHAARGVEAFVNRLGSFLILVGLAGLAVGGVGVASAVRAWMEARVATMATLKVLGAAGRLVAGVYLVQVAAVVVLGTALGLGLGAGGMALAMPLIAGALPFPVETGLFPGALAEAAFYGLLTGFLFALWPLAQALRQGAAAIYRGARRVWPATPWLVLQALLLAALIGGAAWFSGNWRLTLGTLGGVGAVLLVLWGAGFGLARAARRLARSPLVNGRPGLRLALAAIGGPRSEAMAVVLSLGLGLSVLAVVGQIDANFRLAIQRDLPGKAPSFFFIDLQPDQLQPFLDRMSGDPAVHKVESAAMLRGTLMTINGEDARKVAGNHWVVTGDRGISLADTLPPGTEITAGQWWPQGYDGPGQVSFAAQEAKEIGLKLGDKLGLNILGRDIEVTVTSFRKVDFTNAGMGFVMIVDQNALKGAPYTAIATVYADPAAEAGLLREAARTWPNITAISVKEAIAKVVEALTAIATATVAAAGAVLVVGLVVLVGAVSAGVPARVREASVLKVLGATRGAILASFALRAGLMGAAAGLVAVAAGAVGGWAVLTQVMELPFVFEPVSAALIVAGGVVVTLVAGLVFAAVPISARPAGVLRTLEG